jgi:hypothetical protein
VAAPEINEKIVRVPLFALQVNAVHRWGLAASHSVASTWPCALRATGVPLWPGGTGIGTWTKSSERAAYGQTSIAIARITTLHFEMRTQEGSIEANLTQI